MKLRILVLVVAIILGGILRIYKLESRPSGFTWDEAALGYNAFSLFKTGKDEYGQKLPVIFKSFGDYKPGVYIYLSVPGIALFNLNEFTTRMPSAILGTLLVALIAVLASRLIGKSYAWAALLAATNPWLIHFSRGAWEANMALVLLVAGVLLFRSRKYILAGMCFGLTMWTYQGAKLLTPLIMGLTLWFDRNSWENKLQLVKIGVFSLFLIPIVLGWSAQSGRLKVFNVFSYTRHGTDIQAILQQDGVTSKDALFVLFHSEKYDQFRGVALRYLNHFSPRFLFFEGDWTNMRHSIPYYGYLHLPEIFTIVLGLIVLLKSNSRNKWYIIGWLLLAPIPAALSRDNVSGIRALSMVVALVLISSLGIQLLLKNKIITILTIAAFGYFMFYYLDLYYKHAPNFTAVDWLYPYEKSILSVAENYNQYDHIIFSDSLGQPYIFNLFYLKYDPAKYQLQSQLIEDSQGDVGRVDHFDKFEFRHIYWPEDRKRTSTLFVGDFNELPQPDLESTPNLIEISDITYPNGSPGFKVVGLP